MMRAWTGALPRSLQGITLPLLISPVAVHRSLFTIAVLTLALCTACTGRSTPSAPQIGTAFPNPKLVRLDDGSIADLVSYRGKAVLINFWATWCEPCRKEMPSLEALARSEAGRLVVLGVSVDSDLNLAREFVLKQGLTFTNFRDEHMALARDVLGITAFPATFLIAPDGTLAARVTGERDWAGPAGRELLQAFFP